MRGIWNGIPVNVRTMDGLIICSRCHSTRQGQFVPQDEGDLVCERCHMRDELKYHEDVMNDPRESSLVRKNARRRVRSFSKKIKALERREE
jgi:hypothetical protein